MNFVIKNINKILIILSLFLFSCQKTEFIEEIIFDNNLLKKININAKEIEINNLYDLSFSDPFVDHFMSSTPVNRVESWLQDNVVKFGNSNLLVIDIIDASITQNKIIKNSNKKYEINKKEEYIYEINFVLNFNLIDDNNLILSSVNVKVNHTTTSGDYISIGERNKLLDLLTLQALRNLSNKSLELLEKHMQEYLI